MLACTDIAFLTLDDEELLWGSQPVEQVVARTQALGVGEIVIKRGADACLVFSMEGERLEVPAIALPPERVVDTTAAGDSFSAGYGGTPERRQRPTGGAARPPARRNGDPTPRCHHSRSGDARIANKAAAR